jgi:hypothetical protein
MPIRWKSATAVSWSSCAACLAAADCTADARAVIRNAPPRGGRTLQPPRSNRFGRSAIPDDDRCKRWLLGSGLPTVTDDRWIASFVNVLWDLR